MSIKKARVFFFLLLVITFSCEEQGLLVNCVDCYVNEPVTTEIEARLESNYPSGIEVRVFEGNLEDSIQIGYFIVYSKTFLFDVAVNKKYTLTATYYYSGNTYVAVDSATPQVKFEKEQCDDPCYYVYDRICNLKIKYAK